MKRLLLLAALVGCSPPPRPPEQAVIQLGCWDADTMLMAFPEGRYKCCGPWVKVPDAIGPMACNRLAEMYQDHGDGRWWFF